MALQGIDKPGVLEYVNSFGKSFRYKGDDAVSWPFSEGNEIAVQALIDSYSLSQAKDFLKRKVAETAMLVRDQEIASVSQFEAVTWPLKYQEALAYSQSGQSLDAPLLAIEATASEESLQILVDRVLERAAAQHQREATISGIERRLKNQISSFDWAQAKAFRIENVNWY